MVSVEKESTGNFQVRMGVPRKKRWDDTCKARRLNYTKAMNSLVDWWLAQEPSVQLMITGNLPPNPEDFAEAVRLAIEYDEKIVDPRDFDECVADAKRERAAPPRLPADGARAPRTGGRPNRGGGA